MTRSTILPSVLLGALLFLNACHHEKPALPAPAPESGYPAAVARIVESKCAISGCHNAGSYQVSGGGLLLDTWAHLFDGGNTGNCVVPYNLENSSLLYFTNRFADLGLIPPDNMKMPYNYPSLSRDEYLVLRDWVAAGAPDKDGNIPFAAQAQTRQKIYLSLQGCDLIAVIDAEKKVVMRFISVGKTAAIENPHCVRVSPDGKFAYVSFLGGEYLQKINTETDEVVDELYLGTGSWNVFQISPDGKQILISDWRPQPDGKMVLVNTDPMEVVSQYTGVFSYPHGIASNAAFNTFYITGQYGNVVFKLNTQQPSVQQISIDGSAPKLIAGIRDPHEILMVPDGSKYFLTCEHSNEVRVMDAHADTLIRAIPVGAKPQEMAISIKRHIIFVTCMEDEMAAFGYKGAVYAINYDSYETTRIDGPFYQPHGVAVDDAHDQFFVASRNANLDGPAPHHASTCAGRNGYYHVFDLNTFQRVQRRFEVGVEPYSADVRFK